MADEKFESPEAQERAIRDAEAISRADESRANVLRGLAARSPMKGLEALARAAAKEAAESAAEAEAAAKAGAIVDKSGTAPTLSDSEGNFAPNPDVANTGGIGVEASNSTESGDQAQTPEDVDLSPAKVGITDGDQPIGETDDKPRRGRPAKS